MAIIIHRPARTRRRTLAFRPRQFEVNRDHPLAKALKFAGCARHTGGVRYADSSEGRRPADMPGATEPDWRSPAMLRRRALRFDGSRYVNLHGGPTFIHTDYTVSMWVRLYSSSAQNYFAVKASALNNRQIYIYASGSDWHSRVTNTSGTGFIAETSDNRVDTQWHHVCSSVGWTQTGLVELFIDGMRVGFAGLTGSQQVNTSALYLGYNPLNSGKMGGLMADMFYHARILTRNEIAILANRRDPMMDGFLTVTPTRQYFIFSTDGVRPEGIASAEVVPQPTIKSTQILSPESVATAEAVPQPTLATTVTTQPEGVATAEAVPQPTLSTAYTVSPEGITSAEAVPQPTLDTTVTVLPEGIATVEAVPQPTLNTTSVVEPEGVATVEAVPQPTLDMTVTVLPEGVASAETVPQPTLYREQFVQPEGVASAEAVPQPTLGSTYTVLPEGVASAEDVPQPTLATSYTVLPEGIASAEAVPQPTLDTTVTVLPEGIATVEAVPQPTLIVDQTVTPEGVVTEEDVPEPTISLAGQVLPEGVVSAEAVPQPTLAGTVTVLPEGVASAEAVPQPTLAATVTVLPDGVVSAEAVGDPQVNLTIHLNERIPNLLGAIEADPGNDVTVTSTTATAVDHDVTSDTWVALDFGEDGIGLDFVHEFAFFVEPWTTAGVVIAWMVSTELETFTTLGTNGDPMLSLHLYPLGGNVAVTLDWYPTTSYAMPGIFDQTLYYGRVTRRGDSLTAEIFSDAARTVSVSSGTITCPAAQKYRYYHVLGSYGAWDFGLFSGYITDVAIGGMGIPSAEAVSQPTLSSSYTVLPEGVASLEAVGDPTLVTELIVLPEGVESAEVIGSHYISGGSQLFIGLFGGEGFPDLFGEGW